MLLNCFKISNNQHLFHPNLTIILTLLNNFTIVLKEICDDLLHFETFWLSSRIHCYSTVFPLEEPHSAPRRLDFGRFHGRAAETDLRSNPPHPQKGRFLWTNDSSEPQRPWICPASWTSIYSGPKPLPILPWGHHCPTHPKVATLILTSGGSTSLKAR